MLSYGFIILRHVRCERTNLYWKYCYECIRKFYKDNHIIIIDDNSNYDFIDLHFQSNLHNTTIIQSRYAKRGELLPYIYFIENRLFDVAMIIHDSVFINKYFDENLFNTETYKILWTFEHNWDDQYNEKRIIGYLENNSELLELYQNKTLWKGCFGCMSIINHDFLTRLNAKYNLYNIIDHIQSRHHRSCFERIIAVILQKNAPLCDVLGNIHAYVPWGNVVFENINEWNSLPVIKIWTGR